MNFGNADRVETKGSQTKQVNKQCRKSYDANFKLMVIREAENTNNCRAAEKYGILEKNVRDWRGMKNKLHNACSKRKSFRGPKCGRYPEIDEEVENYVKAKREQGFAITREVIQLKALKIARSKNIGNCQFKASLGWCRRMMRRHGLALRRRTTLAQRLPNDFEEKLVEFQRFVINLRKQHGYLLSQIGNADQTPVYFDMPSNTTVDHKGAKSILIKTSGNHKMRITVMLAVLSDGTKLPPYVILKRKRLPKEKLPSGVHVRCQENGWMSEELVKDWLKVVWNNRPGALSKKRAMLVLDAFRGHTTANVKEDIKKLNTDLVVIPGGMTSQLQVLDVVVNKPFKDKLRAQYVQWALEGDHTLTPTGKIQKPSIELLLRWIKAAWISISPESIVAGFKKCCISNALDGTEDDILWECEEAATPDIDNSSSDENSDED